MLRHNRARIFFDPNYDPPSADETRYGVRQRPDDTIQNPAIQPLPAGAPSLSQSWRPIPWRYDNLLTITNFTLNVERDIIGGGSPETPSPGPVPFGCRACIDFFKPVAVDAFSRPVSVLPKGTTVVWRMYIDNRPARSYEAYGIIPGGMNELAGRSLLELVAGQTFRISVQVIGNGMGLSQLGARVAGFWEPIPQRGTQPGASQTP